VACWGTCACNANYSLVRMIDGSHVFARGVRGHHATPAARDIRYYLFFFVTRDQWHARGMQTLTRTTLSSGPSRGDYTWAEPWAKRAYVCGCDCQPNLPKSVRCWMGALVRGCRQRFPLPASRTYSSSTAQPPWLLRPISSNILDRVPVVPVSWTLLGRSYCDGIGCERATLLSKG
jgi:hypothetical protein